VIFVIWFSCGMVLEQFVRIGLGGERGVVLYITSSTFTPVATWSETNGLVRFVVVFVTVTNTSVPFCATNYLTCFHQACTLLRKSWSSRADTRFFFPMSWK
jgi:hypothetical protein